MTTKINFFTELLNRWNQSSPIFFQKLQRFGLWLTATSATLIGLAEIPGITIPDLLPQIAGYMAAAGAMIAVISKLTVKDPNYNTLDQKQAKHTEINKPISFISGGQNLKRVDLIVKGRDVVKIVNR